MTSCVNPPVISVNGDGVYGGHVEEQHILYLEVLQTWDSEEYLQNYHCFPLVLETEG